MGQRSNIGPVIVTGDDRAQAKRREIHNLLIQPVVVIDFTGIYIALDKQCLR